MTQRSDRRSDRRPGSVKLGAADNAKARAGPSTLPTATQPPAPAPEGFSAGWLQLREAFDHRARAGDAGLRALAGLLRAAGPAAGEPWRVIDLACGTGSNLRWLAPRLGGPQQWLVVDHDPALLAHWPQAMASAGLGALRPGGSNPALARSQPPTPPPALHLSAPGLDARIVQQPLDLARGLDALPWQAAHLVTASALLDLVSADWLDRLAHAAGSSRTALLMALSVDGRHRWTPADPFDDSVARLFARHQHRDKGFGPALGAQATHHLRVRLRAAGHRVWTWRSDWQLDGGRDAADRRLMAAMIDGMAGAAAEVDASARPALQAWQGRRQALLGASRLRVGHLDLMALPPERG